ncbi:MAG: hypothetical protein HY682_05870 [Chloroflexi bacterium]|nr:hypothetical protein [Chloroflexota bacterium]
MRVRSRSAIPVFLLILAFPLVLAVACGGGEPTAVPPTSTAVAVQPTPTTAPTAAATKAPTAAPTTAPTAAATATKAAPTATTPAKAAPAGSITIAISSVQPPSGTPRFCTSNCTENLVMMSVFETPWRSVEGDLAGDKPLENVLATGFTLDPGLKFVDLKLRPGVPFHKGYGEMTADDFAFSLNDANRAVTPESISGQAGELASTFAKIETVDKYTARVNFSVFDSRWQRFRLSNFEESIGVTSKAVFDKLGAEGMRKEIIGTGPYEVKEWVETDKTILEAVPNHWRKTASVKTITFIEVREAAVMRAMLETGQVVASAPALTDWPTLTQKGMKPLSGSGYDGYNNIAFSGNWWEKNSARTGQPLTRTRDITKPWVGNPYENGDTYDENTPSMQKSKKVRWALAYAIDRAGLNKSLLSGLGSPIYFGYQPAGNTSFFKKGIYPAGWEIPYDLAKAKALLKEAGYENGFDMDFWIGPTGLPVELMEAIAGVWQSELKVKTNLQKTVYETFRPGLVQRNTSVPLMGCGDGNSGNNPIDAARGFTMSSWSDGGYGVGMELPFAADNYKKTALEPDAQKRIQANLEFIQKSIDWGFCVGVVSSPGYGLYNPNVIADWRPLPISNGGMNNMNNFESIVLK